uniref:Aminotransferase class I/classII domain-containing protein n=3 Tax=Ciona intestinalis TaxID=7719 RepID=H2Y2J5_CIOIN
MMDSASSMVPHVCFFIDSSFSSTLEGLELLMYSQETEQEHFLVQEDLERVWKSGEENFSILPCLSVRSGLDLFLSVKQYPPGSEIIVSSINIPTVIKILHHHNLKIRSCDIDIKTMSPSVQQFKSLITKKTVATLLAHVYGKRFDMQPFINMCKDQNIVVLEDCAETFYGLQFKGHPESDIAFFSFGTIKISTVFGGAIL